MRYRSWSAAGVTVFAVAGTGTVSFAIKVANSARPGLLGFAVQRRTPTGTYRYVTGLKVFRSLVPDPEPGRAYSTNQHPIQSLVWDDFTVTPGTSYDYRFIPLRGRPASPRRGRPAELRVTTEPTASPTHEIHANRGVASSQAYQRRFGGLSPDAQPTAAKRQLALDWLSRDLDDALIAVIRSTGPGDTLRGAFYEFGHLPVLREFADAVARGVDLRLVLDLKVNEHWENQRQRDGSIKKVFVRSAPRLANLEAVTAAGIPMTAIVPREARRNAIQHNKFLVVHRAGVPAEVWTGSTNLTLGGIHGQANVGHLIKDTSLAATFQAYWDLPQEVVFPRSMTSFGFVDYVAVLKNWDETPARHAEVRRVLGLVGLAERSTVRVRKLSGGQRRRLGIAQALLGSPNLLILDEPTTGLDPEQRASLRAIISGLPGTVVLSNHQTEDVSALCDRVIVLDAGTIRFDGSVPQLLATAADRVHIGADECPGAVQSWRTGAGEVRSIGGTPGPEHRRADATVEDAYLLLRHGALPQGAVR